MKLIQIKTETKNIILNVDLLEKAYLAEENQVILIFAGSSQELGFESREKAEDFLDNLIKIKFNQ